MFFKAQAAVGPSIAIAEAFASESRVYCDITDLLFYLRHHTTVSGIQRVICCLIRSWQENRGSHAADIAWVHVEPGSNAIREIDPAVLIEILDALDAPYVTRESVDAALEKVHGASTRASFEPGDTFVILGAFWVLGQTAALLLSLRRQGVRTALYIYDLIPVTHPEFCDAGLARDFAARFFEVAHVVDFAFTISEHVKKEVQAYLRRNDIPEFPITPVPLGQSTSVDVDTSQLRSAVRSLAAQDYVLCVGTIEIRKNHGYLVNIWRRLLADGNTRVPKLVFVGRVGWRVRDLVDQLSSTRNLDNQVVILSDVSDMELAHLYKNCLFTVFPSFVEGWGLPVGESLLHGKVCIASSTSSIPEVGGNAAIYIDPYNNNDGYTKVRNLLQNRSELAAAERNAKAKFVSREWDAVANELFSNISQTTQQSTPKANGITLPAGVWLSVGEADVSQAAPSDRLGSLALVSGWWTREHWGTWTKDRQATLEFCSAIRGKLTVVLRLSSPPWLADTHAIRISDRAGTTTIRNFKAAPFGVLFETTPDADGMVYLHLDTVGPDVENTPDPRWLGAGLIGFVYYDRTDLPSFMNAMEQIAVKGLN